MYSVVSVENNHIVKVGGEVGVASVVHYPMLMKHQCKYDPNAHDVMP